MQNVMAVRAAQSVGRPAARSRTGRLLVLVLLFLVGVIAAAGAALASDYYWGTFGITQPPLEVAANGARRIIRVPPGASIQTALNRANPGDEIELQAGAVYKGVLKLPNKSGAEFITVRTSAVAQLPPADTRLDPKRHGAALATILSNVQGQPAILAENGAHHFRFVGIEFGPTIQGYFNIIQIGTAEERTVDELPHHIEFDRTYVHGSRTEGQRRGIAANGRHIKIANSYISDIKREGEESQAIAVWGGDGPIEITNNYLEAAAESILFGGAESRLGLVPGNATIRDNWMNKPLEWRGSKWVVKNFLEIKSGKRIDIERNLMTNNWAMAQEGTGVLFRTGEDSGKGAIVEDILFADNIMRGSGSAITVFGGEGGGGRRLTIRNNVFEDISANKWEGRGFFIKSSTWDGLTIENNTVIHDGSITIGYGAPVRGLVFRNNIVFNNEYGFFGDGIGSGQVAINRYYPGASIVGNILVGGRAAEYGRENFYPASRSAIGFVAGSAGDYRLRSDSQFSRGGGGKGIGADLDPRTVGGK
ncbi:MAG: hypothetical protein WKF34_08025 [Pyrinomonadaceae bacterium]